MERTRRIRGTHRARGARGWALEVGLWTTAGTVFWLATASTITLAEALVAAGVAVVCSVLARAARRAMPFSARPRGVWLRWAITVPVAAAADMVRLGGGLSGAKAADLREATMPAGGPRETGWRAGGIIALSATPGSVVVSSDRDTGTVMVHTLARGWPRLDDDVLKDDTGQR